MEAKALILAGLETAKRNMTRTLDGLTPAELKWQPKPDANSIGLILFHILRSEDFFVNQVIQGKPQIFETGKWHLKMKKDVKDGGGPYTQAQCEAFAVPDLKDMLAYGDAVRQNTLEYLKGLTPEGMDAKVEMPPFGPPPAKTADGKAPPPKKPPFDPIVGSLLLLTVNHMIQHEGELSYIRGLQRGLDK